MAAHRHVAVGMVVAVRVIVGVWMTVVMVVGVRMGVAMHRTVGMDMLVAVASVVAVVMGMGVIAPVVMTVLMGLQRNAFDPGFAAAAAAGGTHARLDSYATSSSLTRISVPPVTCT